MTNGNGRFEYYLIQLDELLQNAALTDNPALYLYKNDARTKCFMLEGLAKLYAGIHNKKRFEYVKKYFKVLEDLLGFVDYYDCYAIHFLADAEMPNTIIKFMENKRDEKLAELNRILVKKKWIKNSRARTKKLRKKIKAADWLEPKKEVLAIQNFYTNAVKDINEFYKSTGIAFTNMEEQVHELRRKLRWLSIYPHALQGSIQFIDNKPYDKSLTKYLTDDIVYSPFNKMPAIGNNKNFLLLEKKYFLALSSVISALGKIKDEGLQVLAFAQAIKATQAVDDNTALQKGNELNKLSNQGLTDILVKAKAICSPFFMEDNLGKLVVGLNTST